MEQPLELLKREDVRTLAKDMAQLREQDAQKERAKIGNPLRQTPVNKQQTGQEAELRAKEAALERSSASTQIGVFAMPASPAGGPESGTAKKPRRFGKLFIRILLVLIILFVVINAAALAVFLSQKDKGPVAPLPSSIIITPEPIQIPSALFDIPNTEQTELGKNGNLLKVLEQVLGKERDAGFTRVILTLPEERRVWNAKEFLLGLNIQTPQGILDTLQENFTLFAFKNQLNRERIGFALALSGNEATEQALAGWESTLEKDFAPFFSFQGQKDSSAVHFFRETLYKGERIRFQTYSAQDLGLVYALVNNTIVVASSLESMKAVVDKLTTNN
ncbi:MAG: hypothetical protein Q7R55_00245 [Candidatus Wildermuthbacteria bacterium]|nr:hypothetical protein [Candidatus Wildermuthbacteria bacterium]